MNFILVKDLLKSGMDRMGRLQAWKNGWLHIAILPQMVSQVNGVFDDVEG